MSRTQRLGIIVGAVVVGAAAFILFKPDEEKSTTAADKTAPAAKTPTAPSPARRAPAPVPKPKVTRIRIRGGAPVGGVAKVSAGKGETVRLVVSSDVADEVHLHGYDISREVTRGAEARLRFKADIEGIFEVELEQRGVQIAELEVRP